MFRPLYLPLVLLVSIPLAFFAAITTTLAFSTLLVRVAFVYAELGFVLVHSWLLVDLKPRQGRRKASITPTSATVTPRTTPERFGSPQRQKKEKQRSRKASLASSNSSTELQIGGGTSNNSNNEKPRKSGSSLSLFGCGTPNRDYEGVGGWRVPGDGDEEALWMGINSRLELPAAVPTAERRAGGSSHSQRWSWSPEQIRMSPVQSRVRTPSISGMGDLGVGGGGSPVEYFALQPHGRMSSTRVNELLEREVGRRRKSGSWESMSNSGGDMSHSRRMSKVSLK